MKRKKKSSIGFLFWTALILLILVVFLFNKKTIDSVLENTGFMRIVRTENQDPEIKRVDGEGKTAEEPGTTTEEQTPPTVSPQKENDEDLTQLTPEKPVTPSEEPTLLEENGEGDV
ncbi:hypothetical protein, partial [Yoonia sp.]|uniref:hypothetical protein n=1 Tax=Yoonia sp. TaxID=2212373 RepID=UPI00358FB35F